MRVRDLRWYFLAGVILIISYAAMAICYYLSIQNGKVETSMKQLGLEAAKWEAQTIEDRLSSYYEVFMSDEADSLTYVESRYVKGEDETEEEFQARKIRGTQIHTQLFLLRQHHEKQ